MNKEQLRIKLLENLSKISPLFTDSRNVEQVLAVIEKHVDERIKLVFDEESELRDNSWRGKLDDEREAGGTNTGGII